MDHPFPRSTPLTEKLRRLQRVVSPKRDTLAVLINSNPDAMASALALKRLLWRKARHVFFYGINRVRRADNLAFIKLLNVDLEHITHLGRSKITKWAIVDSQPHHRDMFMEYPFDIIIDHHPALSTSRAGFVDIKPEYGATSTIMTEYLRAAKITPSAKLATALLHGIKTDTGNFVRKCIPNDINAFRYLYPFGNMNILKKIESSEITGETLAKFRLAIEKLSFLDGVAFVHMGDVDTPDILVIIADFYMRLAEATWSVVSGVCDQNLVVILRNATLRGDAGKAAKKLFAGVGGSAGGHMSAARAEIPLAMIRSEIKGRRNLGHFVRKRLEELK